MSQQYNKVIKRRRRLAYKKRKAAIAHKARTAKSSKKDKS